MYCSGLLVMLKRRGGCRSALAWLSGLLWPVCMKKACMSTAARMPLGISPLVRWVLWGLSHISPLPRRPLLEMC